MGVPEREGGHYREPKRWRSDGDCTVEGCYREEYEGGKCKRHRDEADYKAAHEPVPSHPDILV